MEENWAEASAVPLGMVMEVDCRLAVSVAKVLVATAWAEVWEAAKVEVGARVAVMAPVLALEVALEVASEAVAPEDLEETTAVGSPVTSNN